MHKYVVRSHIAWLASYHMYTVRLVLHACDGVYSEVTWVASLHPVSVFMFLCFISSATYALNSVCSGFVHLRMWWDLINFLYYMILNMVCSCSAHLLIFLCEHESFQIGDIRHYRHQATQIRSKCISNLWSHYAILEHLCID